MIKAGSLKASIDVSNNHKGGASRWKKKKTKRWLGHIEHWQIVAVFLAFYDVLAVCISYFLALWLRFDGAFTVIPSYYIKSYITFVFPWSIISLLFFFMFRMYSGMWRFESFSELIRTVLGSLTSSIFHTIFITAFVQRMPLSYYLIGAAIQGFLLVAIRFSYRFIQILKKRHEPVEGKRVMLIGAGSSGQLILRDK